MNFKRVVILGAGLLGGSLALALKRFAPGVEVCLWGRREAFFPWAKAHGIEEYSTDLKPLIQGADLVVLSTPIGFMADMVRQVLANSPDHQPLLITDVGSVKAVVADKVNAVIAASGRENVQFVGSHPMAGSEKSGCQDAQADLFTGKACVIDSTMSSAGESESLAAVNSLEIFWQQLGANTVLMNAVEHDHAVAAISHLPHAVASLTAEVALRDGDSLLKEVAGNGFLDTTRIASGHAAMWTEIMLSNREALLTEMKAMQEQCAAFARILESNDEVALLALLQSAKEKRDTFSVES